MQLFSCAKFTLALITWTKPACPMICLLFLGLLTWLFGMPAARYKQKSSTGSSRKGGRRRRRRALPAPPWRPLRPQRAPG